jgi:hypothetical protein
MSQADQPGKTMFSFSTFFSLFLLPASIVLLAVVLFFVFVEEGE